MKRIFLTALTVLFSAAASAQDTGKWAIVPKIDIYTNSGTSGALLGLGASGRYGLTDSWRLEPSITALFHRGCSVDINCNAHYLFDVADNWKVYPLAGLSINDIGGWSAGFNLGGGADYSVARNWDVSAGIKWMVQTAKYHKNPIVIHIGASYKF